VKRLITHTNHILLKAENPDYSDILISQPERLIVWGVVTYVIHGV
jgi:DNA polymerase V